MKNPFLLHSLQTQGLNYILFNNSEQKKEYNLLAINNNKNNLVQQKTIPQIKQPITETTKRFESPKLNNDELFKKTLPTTSTQKEIKKETTNNFFSRIIPFAEWSPLWRNAHKRCKLPTERPKNLSNQVIWTYAGLENDLFTDSPNADRRNVISYIIQSLAHPRGTHLYIPYKLFYGNEAKIAIENNALFFWSAIDLVRPRVLVTFGEDTLQDLNLPPLLPTQKHFISPITIYALDNILHYAHNPKDTEIMIHFLQSNLRGYA